MFILLADDDMDDQDFFKEALHRIDPKIECINCINGAEALKTLRHSLNLPNIIFLDLNMPKMGGQQCLATIKSDERLCDIPVYIYTTSGSKKDRVDTSNAGANNFIVKPNSISELIAKLKEIFAVAHFI